ncbi:hypothetical protein CMO90_04295 [Candidatus Woesearchaeota archaeon]|nr:hypothetical protein [Candidatus Woesearchaeota archaeon]|tara:strand:- start:1105 stop:1509 length:405 start_codon:yes stop_codon:yes gene_type:complete
MMLKQKVIIDTNFLLIPGIFKVDIFTEIKRLMNAPYKLFLINKSFEELNKIIVLGKIKDREAAKLGLILAKNLIKQKSLKTIGCSSKKSVDDIIVEKTNKKVFVATMDKELKHRIKKKDGKIITLKQKKYLIVE